MIAPSVCVCLCIYIKRDYIWPVESYLDFIVVYKYKVDLSYCPSGWGLDAEADDRAL
jgi:hypothetical protein